MNDVPLDELYIIFTSGTTGTPKGISISENAVLNTIDDIVVRTKLNISDVIFNISDLTFDLSIFDVLSPLIIGCKTFLCPSPNEIVENKNTVLDCTFWNSTPGLVQTIINLINEPIMNIRNILMSGDFIPSELVEQIRRHFLNPNLNIFSLGGATEASIWSIYYPLNNFWGDKVPYGYPLSNQRFHVLNEDDELLNTNVAGELIISGMGLANGYINNMENDRIFYKHSDLGFIYRTGDKGFFNDKGYMNIIGRMKTELKINGYRIDLIEVEKALVNISDIKNVKVQVNKNEKGKSYLIAFYTTKSGVSLKVVDFRKQLKKMLPNYMIPTSFVFLEQLPLTQNGKIDTKALLSLHKAHSLSDELSNEEQKLLYIWKKVIDQDFEVGTISKTETFFEVGGDSIKLPELLHEINNEYNISVSAEELLNSFTLQEQASMIIQMQSKPIVCTKTNKFLIQLKKGYSKKNVVLIHAGSGEIGIYNELSKNIDNSYNVYAIRFDKNTDNLSPRIFDFPDLARRYNEYLTDFESIDYIGGWCIGGTIGYEICKINNNIKNLLLINTLPPVKEKQQIFQFNLESELEFIKKSFGYTPINVASMDNLWSEIVRLIDNNPKTMKKLVSIVPQELSRLIPFFGENSPKELIYYINLFRSFETARKLYQETGVIPNNICYIGANEEVIPAYEDWRKRIKGTWSEAHVTGDHTTIFDNPNVIKLAEFINNHSEQGGD